MSTAGVSGERWASCSSPGLWAAAGHTPRLHKAAHTRSTSRPRVGRVTELLQDVVDGASAASNREPSAGRPPPRRRGDGEKPLPVAPTLRRVARYRWLRNAPDPPAGRWPGWVGPGPALPWRRSGSSRAAAASAAAGCWWTPTAAAERWTPCGWAAGQRLPRLRRDRPGRPGGRAGGGRPGAVRVGVG